MTEHYVQGKPAFLKMHGPIRQYPYLTENIETEVVIVGGGVTGSIMSYYLSKAGVKAVVLEKRRIAHGSSSISTSLLQYELDSNARDLEQYVSLDQVITSYKLGLKALSEIKDFINTHGNQCGYEEKDTLLYTAKEAEICEIEEEYRIRKEAGLEVKLIKPEDGLYDFDLKAGLYATKGGASLNPYQFTHQLLEVSMNQGVKVYENTRVDKVIYEAQGVTVITEYGYEVKANKLILATGYDTDLFTPRQFGQKSISYNIVTQPLNEILGWHNQSLIRDNEETYHYLRTTPDQRIIIGGVDTPYEEAPITEDKAKQKYEELLTHLKGLFPRIRPMNIEYGCCGVFATTQDNLGFIGPDPDHSQLWYCLGYGANGILFAILGGMMLTKLYQGEKDEYLELFRPNRFDGMGK